MGLIIKWNNLLKILNTAPSGANSNVFVHIHIFACIRLKSELSAPSEIRHTVSHP